MRWSCFCPSFYCVKVINQSCFPAINCTWPWCWILSNCCWILFAHLLKVLASVFMRIFVWFFFSSNFGLLWCQDNTGILVYAAKCSSLIYFLKGFVKNYLCFRYLVEFSVGPSGLIFFFVRNFSITNSISLLFVDSFIFSKIKS